MKTHYFTHPTPYCQKHQGKFGIYLHARAKEGINTEGLISYSNLNAI